MHEGLGSLALWRDVPEKLAQATALGTLNYSRYGNGFSQTLAEPRPVSYMHDEAHALRELLDAREVDRAILFGQSDGASVALIAAATNGARIIGIVVEAPHVFVEDLSVNSIAAAKTAYEQSDLRARLARHHADVDRTFYGWNDIWLSPAFRSWNITPLLPKITAPILCIQGEDDEYGTTAQVQTIARDAKNARVDSLYLAKCGHAPHRDRPEMVIAAITAFATSL